MPTDRPLDEATAEALLAGRTTAADESLGALLAFVEDMRAVGQAPAPAPSAALASVLASGLATEKGDLLATAASNVTGPAPQAAGLPKWRRRTMVESVLSGIMAKLAGLGVLAKAGLGLGVAVASVGGAAAAGVPAAQDAVEAVTSIEFGGQSVHDTDTTPVEETDEVTEGDDVVLDGDEGEPAGPPEGTKGAVISNLARTTPPGPEHGAVVSGAASEGKSRAGTNGQGRGGSAPVATPNTGGTGTADQASSGASAQGTARANEASGGRAAAGSGNSKSGNAETGLSRRP